MVGESNVCVRMSGLVDFLCVCVCVCVCVLVVDFVCVCVCVCLAVRAVCELVPDLGFPTSVCVPGSEGRV